MIQSEGIMRDKHVIILMATYNGSKYLPQQLDSILAQSYDNWRLLIRDDGSGDETLNILKDYQKKDTRISILDNQGKKLGVIGNFFELIKSAPESDYYALSDQDDYWYPQKLEHAVACLEQNMSDKMKPLLYCGAKEIADENLNVQEISSFHHPKLTWQSALVENLCTGCTCVFNNTLRKLAVAYTPKRCVMHDWWLYLLAVGLGEVWYDEKAYIKYRQHGNNVCGDINSGWRLLRYRIQQLFAKRGQIYEQTQEFINQFGVLLAKRNLKIARLLVASKYSMKARRLLLHKHLVYRQTPKDTSIVKFLVLTGKL